VKFSWGLVKDELDTAGFLVVTAIQVFASTIYYGIRDNKELFSGVFESSGRDSGQKKEVRQELKKVESGQKESVRRLYRMLSIPSKEGTKEIDLGIPTYGEEKSLDEEVYERLRSGDEILEKVAPLFLREKYLSNREYVNMEQLYTGRNESDKQNGFGTRHY